MTDPGFVDPSIAEACKSHFKHLLEAKWLCGYGGHQYCFLGAGGVHKHLDSGAMDAWSTAMLAGQATLDTPPPAMHLMLYGTDPPGLSHNSHPTPPFSQWFNSLYVQENSDMSSNASMFSSTSRSFSSSAITRTSDSTALPGIGFHAGTAVKWIGEQLLKGAEPLFIGRRRQQIRELIKETANWKWHFSCMSVEAWLSSNRRRLDRACTDLLELTRHGYPTPYREGAARLAVALGDGLLDLFWMHYCSSTTLGGAGAVGSRYAELLDQSTEITFAIVLFSLAHSDDQMRVRKNIRFLGALYNIDNSRVCRFLVRKKKLVVRITELVFHIDAMPASEDEALAHAHALVTCARIAEYEEELHSSLVNAMGIPYAVRECRSASRHRCLADWLLVLEKLSDMTYCVNMLLGCRAIGVILDSLRTLCPQYVDPWDEFYLYEIGSRRAMNALQNICRSDNGGRVAVQVAITDKVVNSLALLMFDGGHYPSEEKFNQIHSLWPSITQEQLTGINENIIPATSWVQRRPSECHGPFNPV